MIKISKGPRKVASRMKENAKREVIHYLKEKEICSLATLRRDGYPQANVVDYVNDGLTLYMATFATASKVDNIRFCPKVSLTVGGKSDDINQTKGVSLAGEAFVLNGKREIQRARRLLLKKFPYVSEFPDEQLAWIKVRPRVIYFVDYSKGIGHQDIIEISKGVKRS
jgi:general stress protein 26